MKHERISRLRDLGAATAQAAMVVGTVGLLGAGYYGYHRSNTGETIQRLVPEWEVEPVQEVVLAQAPRCTEPPQASRSRRRVLPVRFEYTFPGSDTFCDFFMGSGSWKVRLDLGGSGEEAVDAQCARTSSREASVTAGVYFCPYLANVRASGRSTTWERLCRQCTAPPRETCAGSKCLVQGYEGEGNLHVGYEWERRAQLWLGIEGKVKARLEAGGGMTYRSSDRKSGNTCGGCNEPDCSTRTVGVNLGDPILTLGGEAKLGWATGQIEGRCRFTPNLSVTVRSDTCPSGGQTCYSASASLSCTAIVRGVGRRGAGAGGPTLWAKNCSGAWSANGCGADGGVPSRSWACRDANVTEIF